MTKALGTYSFLPWLRQGLANQITAGDFDPNVKVRPTVKVSLELQGDKVGGGVDTRSVSKDVSLFGPGDLEGIDARAIVRMEPRPGATNFEPNYLACVEFYDEDYPWRYTPAAPDLARNRLRPWLTLLVLKEGDVEFVDGKEARDRPLPYIDVLDPAVFPRADELWAWAHVHVNGSLAGTDEEFSSTDMNAVLPRLAALIGRDPDLAYSRLISPRKLAENTGYHAFLIPTFETGRRTGLKLDLGNIPATMSAWDPGPRPEPQSHPVYHRWYFRTGASGDFETLVRLLKAKPVDPRVGVRDMDVQDPRASVRPLDKPELGGILKLGGALRRPATEPPEPPDAWETWDVTFPRPLQEDLARLINLPEQYARAGDPDPVITPPLYGTWHALTKRVLTNADGTPMLPAETWVHRLNLDPRFRVPAGFGTRVVQDQQEAFMDAAWSQIGKVLEAQRRIRAGQFALHVSDIWFDRHLLPTLAVSRQQTLHLIAPLNKRVLTAGVTVHHAMTGALLQPTMTSAALRRVIRPRARLITSLPFTATRRPADLVDRVNAGEVSAAPPRVTPPGLLTPDQIADAALPSDAPPAVLELLRRHPRLPWLMLIAALVLILLMFLVPFGIGTIVLGVAAAGGLYAWRRLSGWSAALRGAEAVREVNQTVAAIDALPGVSNFAITDPATTTPFTPRGGADSVEAARLKQGLRDSFELVEASVRAGKAPLRAQLDLAALARTSLDALRPTRTIPARITASLFLPPRITSEIGDGLIEPMAYPVIDQPMYEPLKNLSAELFLPNINLIEHNTITLLETNQRFIEAYMVGLNHEFARELLWREYPTDQRGSTFRQFWDPRGFFNADNVDDETLKESLRDIPPLHTWPATSPLGTHDHRERGGENEDELVLVIRGELLKRYPNAVIYAHRACWQRTSVSAADRDRPPCERAGAIDNTRERLLAPLTPEEEDRPPRTKVLTPLYEAKVDPDIYFFGFDLTVKQAKGGSGQNPADDPGWFFVLKERPGELRFGLDTDQQPHLNTWNDLSWADVQPTGSHIEIATSPAAFTLLAPTGEDQEKAPQFADDRKIAWSREMSSAELAYILFQVPVLVGVHAAEMLPPAGSRRG
jgi:hypothetical protein